MAGHVTGKQPPSWDPASQNAYSFEDWVLDVTLWSEATDLSYRQQGPMVVLGLGGLARELAREVPATDLTNGNYLDTDDGQGYVWHSGLVLLLHGLRRKFAPLQVEEAVNSMTSMVAFRRRPGEPIDAAVARFQLLRFKSESRAGFAPGPTAVAWMLLNALGIPPNQWAALLAPSQGSLPQNEPQLNDLMTFIRRQGHLYEATGLANAAQVGAREGKSAGHMFGQSSNSFWVDPRDPVSSGDGFGFYLSTAHSTRETASQAYGKPAA